MDSGSTRAFWAETTVESGVYLLLAVPFYAAGAYLADATATDAVRTGLFFASLLPLAWAALMAAMTTPTEQGEQTDG